MLLPVMPPVRPMLAKAVQDLPRGQGLAYEPKWDGFRCIVFRDSREVELGSRNERPLTRYFPELVDALQGALPERCVVDGEIVVATERGLDFEALQSRLHPATSRVARLARETPASFVAFDLLAAGNRNTMDEPFENRRALLEELLAARPAGQARLTPTTRDPDRAQDWFTRFEGAGFDGVIAKLLDQPYRPDERAMWKVKHQRTAECVVGGFRWHKDGRGVGSLLLGLYESGVLHHVGVTSSFTAALRRDLAPALERLRVGDHDGHPWRQGPGEADGVVPAHATGRVPGTPSRWSAGRDLSWVALRPEAVVEVRYGHLMGGRFRHPARLVRFRPDRDPASCTYSQLEVAAPPAVLSAPFGADRSSGHG